MGTHTHQPVGSSPLPSSTLHILLALAEGEKHGYAIMRDVEAMSSGAVRMGPGTLYGSIKRMLADGLIEETDDRPDPEMDDQRRRYYRLTQVGQRACNSEVDRLRALVAWAHRAQPDRGFVARPGAA